MKITGDKNRLLQMLLLGAAVGFMITGWINGELQMVLEKSVNICLECIGIG
ncbi:MAG: hypothetical protein HFI33_00665 [Lachnospiraceae bacterium]|nr:hypothetical protein [Lachnospiraceae bacterium]